ncbi:MAG: aminotransferase class III-fold pyridoxal phosphate-dependent enzyme [Terricaulis sp.]
MLSLARTTETRSAPLDLGAYWMPFTANRAFKQAPRLIARAQDHNYWTDDGREVLDGFSGLWTTGLGHGRPEIADAVHRQLLTLDYAPAFQIGHPGVFKLATALAALAPDGLTQSFFTNSGSEAVETALKLALAYHAARGKREKVRFVGRERAYHGVNLGGLSVGGIAPNREAFKPALLDTVLHLPATHNLAHNAFSKGQPLWGAHLADALEDFIAEHGETIAAVIVEPVAGSTGVLPPPVGYLERLREITLAHDILLIFDEVITGFGRVGAAFAAERFGVTPDVITTAKGLTNGAIPMGAVIVRQEIHDALMQGPAHAIEFFHGYTYSGHPVAAASALAVLDIYARERSFAAARKLESVFETRLHQAADARHVRDVRNFGLMGAIELEPREDAPGARGLEAHIRCFEQGVLVRNAGDTIQIAPFLNGSADEIDRTLTIVEKVIETLR